MNLVSVLEHSSREYPEKPAVLFADQQLTFRQVNTMANQVANSLKSAGIKPGEKIALSCPNLPYFPIIYYAILKTGAVVVPINVLLKAEEIAYHLSDSDARAYFCFQGTKELPMAVEGLKGFNSVPSCELFYVITPDPASDFSMEEGVTLGQMMVGQPVQFDTATVSPHDTAVILYTSGTTGLPKGAELSHSNMTMNAMVSKDLMNITRDDVTLVVLPLFHSFGQTCLMNASLMGGAGLVLMPRFDPQAVLDIIPKARVTIFGGVPTMYWALLNCKVNQQQRQPGTITETLRLGVSAGSPLPLEVINGFEDAFGIPIMEGYGLSETSPVVTFNQPDKERKPGSVGTPVWGVEVRIVDRKNIPLPPGEVGEIVIRGHNVMKGYHQNDEATAKAFNGTGWFHSGDLGKTDEDGYVYIVDRVKDMIIRGGYNVYPREIEEKLMTHEAVSLASVFGVPHPRHGEEIKACIVLNRNAKITEDEIFGWARENMAAYKYPRIIDIKETLPMTATGKILKSVLKEESESA